MAAWKAVAGDGLLYLTLVLSIFRSDLNPSITNYINQPELQEALLGQNLGLHIIDPHRDFYNPSKHILDENEVIRQEINRLIHTSSNFVTYNQEISAWLVVESNGNLQNETASHTYVSPSASSSTHADVRLNPEDQDLIQIIIQTDAETLNKQVPVLRPAARLAQSPSLSTTVHNPHSGITSAHLWTELTSHTATRPSESLADLDDLDDSLLWSSSSAAQTLGDVSLYRALLRDQSLCAEPSTLHRANSSGDLMSLSSNILTDEHSPHKGLFNLSLPALPAASQLLSDDLDQIDLDLDADLDTDLLDEISSQDWRKASLSEDSAVSMGSSTSVKDWGDNSSDDSQKLRATGGSEYPDFSRIGKREPVSPDARFAWEAETWGDDLSDDPLVVDIHHDHRYAAPLGGQPHIRKMDIKIEREPSRGEAHDEILVRKARIPFSVETIISIPVDRFNQLLKKHKLSSKQADLVRDIRKRGKNKVAAQNCRRKKIIELTDLELEIRSLHLQRESLITANSNLKFQSDEIRKSIDGLTTDLFSRMRNPSGNHYNPNHYSIEVDESGSVEVVSPDSQSNQSRSNRRSRKRRKRF